MKFSYCLYLLFTIFFLSTCKKGPAKDTTLKKEYTSTVRYAKGFDIINNNGIRKLAIKTPYQNAKEAHVYMLDSKSDITRNTIKVPVEKVIVTSTTHIPMLELLGVEENIIGFPNTKFVSSKKTRALIDKNKIKEVGQQAELNTEVLIDLKPELIVGFSVDGANASYDIIQKAGIPVILNGEWLEETPLGRAEWIKFFGVLFGKEHIADSIFNSIEKNYLQAKLAAAKIVKSPTVMTGSLYKDIWYVPGGKSFAASFFKDANLHYLWRDAEGTGSLSLSLETVLDKANRADFWLGCGLCVSKEQLMASNNFYDQFEAFKKDKVYTIATKKGATGGIIYFELAPTRPDLVLKDLITIIDPDIFPDYELTFYEKLK